MFNRDKITELAKSVLKPKGVISGTSLIHPTREWGIGLVIAVVVFLITSFWSLQTYLKHKNLSVTDKPTDIQTPEYKADLIDGSLEIIKNKATEFDGLVAGAKNIPAEVVPDAVNETPVDQSPESEIDTASSTETVVTEVVPESENIATSSYILIIQGE